MTHPIDPFFHPLVSSFLLISLALPLHRAFGMECRQTSSFPSTLNPDWPRRLRRQSDRIQIRLTVLLNELGDTIAEHQAMSGKAQSARLVLEHMQAQEEEVVKK